LEYIVIIILLPTLDMLKCYFNTVYNDCSLWRHHSRIRCMQTRWLLS